MPQGVAYTIAVPKKLPPEVLEFFRKQGANGGKLGAKARMVKMTPEQRSESARRAVVARWKKVREEKDAKDKP